MNRVFLSGIFFLLIASTCLSQSAVSLSLTLDPDRTLPGIPVPFRLVASNESGARVVLPDPVILKVTPESGESFYALWESDGRQIGILPQEPSHEILAGQTKEYVFSIDATLSEPGPFGYDTRLSLPGTYRLQVILDPKPDSTLAPGSITNENPVFPKDYVQTPMYSDTATLEVEGPNGEDAVVWARMQEFTKGRGWTGKEWIGLATEIWKMHFTSNYVPYIVPMVPGSSREDRIAIAEQAISMYPNHRMLEWIHFAAATSAELESQWQLAKYDDWKRAKGLHDKAQSHLEEVVKIAKNPQLRKEAEEMRSKWEDILKSHEEEKKRQRAGQ